MSSAKLECIGLFFCMFRFADYTIFVFLKLQKIKKRNGFLRRKLRKSSAQGNFTPAFAKPMLYAVLFIQCGCKYAGEAREIYSFFSVGKKWEGKCSFCIFFGRSVGQNTKCAFSFAVDLLFCFLNVCRRIGIILVHKSLLSNVMELFVC